MGGLPAGVETPVEVVPLAAAVDVVGVTLTSRENEVYRRICRNCASRPNGTVAARLIGSAGACRSLIGKGLIVEEVQSIGRQGGVYLCYRLGGPVEPDGGGAGPVGPVPLTGGYPHGVPGSYTNHGCRCPLCTDAHALALAGYRAVRSPGSAPPGDPVIRADPPRQAFGPRGAGVSDGLNVVACEETAHGCGPGPDVVAVAGGELSVPPPADISVGLRRPPMQARARERVERLLDAAERVFVDVGVEAASTTQIAAEGDTSVGPIYQFFTDKQGVIDALAARYVTALRTALDEDGGAALGGIVDTIARFAERHPGLGPLLQRSSRSGSDDLSLKVNTVLTDHLDRLLSDPHEPPGPARRRTVAVMCASLLRCLFEMLSAQPSRQRAVVVAETRVALIAYATTALPPGGRTRAAVTTPGVWPTTGQPRNDSTEPQGPRRNPARRAVEPRPGPRRNPARQNPERPPPPR